MLFDSCESELCDEVCFLGSYESQSELPDEVCFANSNNCRSVHTESGTMDVIYPPKVWKLVILVHKIAIYYENWCILFCNTSVLRM